MNIGSRIKQERERRNMSLEDVAKAAGTTRQTIFKYENGIITNIPLDKIEKIAASLCVHPAYIMGWTENKKSPAKDGDNKNALALMELIQGCSEEQAARLLEVLRLFLDSSR